MSRVIGITIVLLCGCVGISLISPMPTSHAQNVTTPNATVRALQTEAADWAGQLPDLQATQTAIDRQMADAQRAKADQIATVSAVQAKINAANVAANSSLGQQALDLAGQAQQQIQPLLTEATPLARQQQDALTAANNAAVSVQTIVPHLVATAQAYPVAVQTAVYGDVDRLSRTVERQGQTIDQQAQELATTRAIAVGCCAAAIALAVWAWRRRATSAPATRPIPVDTTTARPLSDDDRLPRSRLHFSDDEELLAHLDQVHHDADDESATQ